MSFRTSLSLALCGAALSCFGQGIQVGGPITGLVYDAPSKSLRQILGMPGAARLGAPLLSEVDWASVAPDGRTAVVVVNGEARLVSSKDITQESPGAPIMGLLSAPRFSSWAEDSSSLVLYSAENRSLQWVRLNAQSVEADPAMPLTGFDGEVTAMAADKASAVTVLSVAGSGVYLVGSSGAATLLLPSAEVSAIALEPGGQTLWVADRTNAQLVQLTELGFTPTAQVLISDPEKLADISALGLSFDKRRLYLASRSTQLLYEFDRSAALLSEGIALDAPAELLLPLGRPSLRLLGQRGKLGAPLYLLDEKSGPGLFFVPAGEGEQQ